MMKPKAFSTILPPALLKRLEAFKGASGMTLSAIVARALDKYLKEQGA